MDFDLSWLLMGLPLAFVLGWLASRLDLRQLRIENRQAPKAYFKGLNFLLNEQQDQAIDAFIEAEIKPLQAQDDNERFFDHRREWARTDFDNGGLPRHEWEVLLRKVKNVADAAGHLRFAIPKRYGGKDGSNLWMAVIREHFAASEASASPRQGWD